MALNSFGAIKDEFAVAYEKPNKRRKNSMSLLVSSFQLVIM